jgi:hypothetical protein
VTASSAADSPRPARLTRPGAALLIGTLAALVLGAIAFALLSDAGLRAAASYLGAAALAGALLYGGIAAVQLFAAEAPGLSWLIAMITYLTTVAVFGAILGLGSPDVIDGLGFAAGLVLMVVASTIQQWRVNRVPPGPHPPLPPPLAFEDPEDDADG